RPAAHAAGRATLTDPFGKPLMDFGEGRGDAQGCLHVEDDHPCPIWLRCAQPVVRFSIQAISAYMAMPSTASMTRPAKTSGVLNWLCAWLIIWPSPLFEPTVSESTEPTKASVIATFSEP